MNLKKKIGKVFTSKFVGTGPSSYEIKNLPGRGLTKFEKHWDITPKHAVFTDFYKIYALNSGFHLEAYENCDLLGCYAASGVNFLPTIRSHLQVSK